MSPVTGRAYVILAAASLREAGVSGRTPPSRSSALDERLSDHAHGPVTMPFDRAPSVPARIMSIVICASSVPHLTF
jgi:hypothetical protein